MDLNSRVQSSIKPFRTIRPASKKIIFYSCEGVVTEEEYFSILSHDIFSNIKEKLTLATVREDFINTPKKDRSQQDYDEQNKSTPLQVMERMKQFKIDKASTYKFSENLDDEFWLVIDVDDHTDKYHIDEFNFVIKESRKPENNFKLAVTNPFFEFWLFAHHLSVTDEAKAHANTVNNPFFRNKMSDEANVNLINDKKPEAKDYNKQKIIKAVEACKELHTDKSEYYPSQLGSHVYLLVQQLIELSDSF
ncbi:MAG: RloB family protein [Clostridiales bacterium]|jgi:hypothetical protein|nr:RloB family protein [Clostridiales bacterium]